MVSKPLIVSLVYYIKELMFGKKCNKMCWIWFDKRWVKAIELHNALLSRVVCKPMTTYDSQWQTSYTKDDNININLESQHLVYKRNCFQISIDRSFERTNDCQKNNLIKKFKESIGFLIQKLRQTRHRVSWGCEQRKNLEIFLIIPILSKTC